METRPNQILKPQECLDIIKKKLNQNSMIDFSMIKYEIVPFEEANGYLGQYFYLKASVARPESPTDRRNVNFFIKIRPLKGTKQYDVVCNSGMFNREIRLYTKVFSEILDQSDKKYIPECYLGIENEMLVLDDVISKGYRNLKNKLDPLDLDHCNIVIETLAKFHAKSVIFEERNKMNLLDLCHEKKIIIRSYDEPLPFVFEIGLKCALSVIDSLPELDSSTREKFKTLLIEIHSKFHEKLRPCPKKRNVQLHGDLWTNNLMFKYNSDGKPEKCYFIDFQNTRYADYFKF